MSLDESRVADSSKSYFSDWNGYDWAAVVPFYGLVRGIVSIVHASAALLSSSQKVSGLAEQLLSAHSPARTFLKGLAQILWVPVLVCGVIKLIDQRFNPNRQQKIEPERKIFQAIDDRENEPVDEIKNILELIEKHKKEEFKDPKLKQDPMHKRPLNDPNTLNLRTTPMVELLAGNKDFNEKNLTLNVQGVSYKVITSDITDFADIKAPLVSCGSSKSREMILFDPENSPLLQKRYAYFSQALQRYMKDKKIDKLTPEQMIMFTTAFMQKVVFPVSKNLVEQVDMMVENCKKDAFIAKSNDQPCIPIDKFLEEKQGVCRHHSLVAAYFMDRFMKHHSDKCAFSGKLQVMRDNLDRGGAHAWLTLICDDGSTFAIDTLNNISGNLNDYNFQQKYKKSFGFKPLNHQKKKAEIVRNKLGF